MQKPECIFCQFAADPAVVENDAFYARFDKYPVSQGHLLIIPRRHVETLFELTEAERTQLFSLLEAAKDHLTDQFHPDGFNFGVNQGISAGQTIPHLHIHIIPRYEGDMAQPEGGVRGVIPEKQKYRR